MDLGVDWAGWVVLTLGLCSPPEALVTPRTLKGIHGTLIETEGKLYSSFHVFMVCGQSGLLYKVLSLSRVYFSQTGGLILNVLSSWSPGQKLRS